MRVKARIKKRKKGGRTKSKDREVIVDMVVDALGKRLYKHEIKSLIRKAVGHPFVDPGSYEDYILEARRKMCAMAMAELKDTKGDAVAFYEGVVRSKDSTQFEKVRAQERLDWIYGNDAKFASGAKNMVGIPILLQAIFKVLPKQHHQDVMDAVREAALGARPEKEAA